MGEAHPSGDRIRREHRDIRECLDALAGASDLYAIARLAEELRGMLDAHIAFEESPEGLPALVTDLAPNQRARCEALLAEHPALRAGIAALKALAERCLAERTALVDAVRAHEARECELLCEILYTDLGCKD